MTGITISKMSKSFGAATVLDDLSLTVEDGEFLSLLGPSGCGKTTTLRCLAGLEDPTQGSIRLGQEVIVDAGRGLFLPPNRRGLGMVFQSYALWPHMTVFGNVAYPLKLQRRGKAEIRRKVAEALDLVGLAHLQNRPTSDLSGGQQQRIAVARALAGEPRLLLLDEPLSNLDAALRGQMRRELRRIHAEVRRTSIYVTHDQLEAATLSDRIVVMNAGRIEQLGTPHDIFARPASVWVAGFVGYENFLPATVLGREGALLMARPDGWDMPLACVMGEATPTAPGARVTLALRASGFSDSGGAGDARVETVVRDTLFVGDQIEYTLGTGTGAGAATLTCRLPLAADPASGTDVGSARPVYVAPGQAVALAPETAPLQSEQAA